MANRVKRLQLAQARQQEAEKIAAALSRCAVEALSARYKRRRPEQTAVAGRVLADIRLFFSRLPEAKQRMLSAPQDYIVRSRVLLRALVQRPQFLTNVLFLLENGLLVRQPASWRAPRSMDPVRVLNAFVGHCFVRFAVPRPLWVDLFQSWDAETSEEQLRLFLHFAAGYNLRTAPGAGSMVTRKMAALAWEIPENVWWKHMKPWAFLRAMNLRLDFIREILDNLPEETIYSPRYRHFWLFLSRHPELAWKEAYELLDFFRDQSGNPAHVWLPRNGVMVEAEPLFPDFDFQGATLASAQRRVAAWKKHLDQLDHRFSAEPFPEDEVPGLETGPYTIVQLRTADELVREGRAMRHCVASYVQRCVQQKVSIWSLQRDRQRIATIELDVKRKLIAQVKGKYNRTPDTTHLQLVQTWAQSQGLAFGS